MGVQFTHHGLWYYDESSGITAVRAQDSKEKKATKSQLQTYRD